MLPGHRSIADVDVDRDAVVTASMGLLACFSKVTVWGTYIKSHDLPASRGGSISGGFDQSVGGPKHGVCQIQSDGKASSLTSPLTDCVTSS